MDNIENEMFQIAVNFLNNRYGRNAGGVAVLRIDNGEYLTSVWPEANNSSVDLCAETGAICEAHKLNKKLLIQFVFVGKKMMKIMKY
jgi:cytidine deaminase